MIDDDDDVFSTRRITADQMDQLHKALETRTADLSISVGGDVLDRIEKLLPMITDAKEANQDLRRAMAMRQIFMAGLYALESEVD
jgi:hypothetical protein